MYTMDDFWVPTLGSTSKLRPSQRFPDGWVTESERLQTFVEAPLDLAEGFGEEPTTPIVLVSAPGAVGKSTLAREIATCTGAVLIDLAKSDAVGASTITGGLAWTRLFEEFIDGNVALLIDGLDEARIRVTQDSFVAFLRDIHQLAHAERKAITLFGRTAAIEDTWLYLSEMGVEPAVLEIQFYQHAEAIEFVGRQTQFLRAEDRQNIAATADADRKAAELILDSYRKDAREDGDRFVGYAPVLIAVARRIAAERNPVALVQQLATGAEGPSLKRIVDAILEREKTKLDSLDFTDERLKACLYGRDEQVERLISAVYGIDHKPALPEMNQQDAKTYAEALATWVPDHAFTDGTGIRPSSEVFGGFIAAEALKREWSSAIVRSRELEKVNPFLWRFALPECWTDPHTGEVESDAATHHVRLADLGLSFASVRAQLAHGEAAHLSVDADQEVREADAEITRDIRNGTRLLYVETDYEGTLYFGSRIGDVAVSGEMLKIVLSGPENCLIAPVDLDVEEIDAGESGLVVEGPRHGRDTPDSAVNLRCGAFKWLSDSLSVRPGVQLAVAWPGSELFPWRNYRMPELPPDVDDELRERLLRLRKILVLFRARGKDQLAKLKKAIDHKRRAGGSGAAVRDLLLEEGVLLESGRLYVLDTDRLGEVLGLSFQDIQLAMVNAKTIEFLQRI